ncbi:homocysteine S-methyltransferase family protein [Candidatus Woesearchaeota archaeon]|nr:homocysteine S-methyltransferase family protein [Candidatus Woesearchaeota archaeon]
MSLIKNRLSIRELLDQKRILLLDGAMGTELQRRGVKTALPLWSAKALIECPDLVTAIHRDYVDAGADIITVNTFRTQRIPLMKAGFGDQVGILTRLACQCAHDALVGVSRSVFIAGSMAPLEDCYEPSLVPANDILYEQHKEHALALVEGGVDFIILETFNCIRDAEIAARVVRELGKDFIVSFVCNEEGLLSGENLAEAITQLLRFNPVAIGINCCSTEVIEKHLKTLGSFSIPVIVYANGEGHADNKYGWEFEGGVELQRYLDFVRRSLSSGVRIIGGCCGTSPEYIREIKKLIDPENVEILTKD